MRIFAGKLSSMKHIIAGSTLLALLTSCCSLTENASESASSGPTSCPSNIAWQSPQLPPNNAQLLSYARSKSGSQVGSGECADLPHLGLPILGMKTFSQLGPTGSNADYVWGDRVATITPGGNARGVLPGDVIQYRNFAQRVSTATGSWTSSAQHHSSIVRAVSGDGKHICVYEQNAGGRRTVGIGYLALNGMTQGTLWAYRPRR